MIVDALRAELLKLTKNRWALFWCWGFVPVLILVTGVLIETFSRSMPAAAMLAFAAPITSALDGLGGYGNVFLRLFPVAGGALLFAGEYRWETWRAILPRNERTAIMLAKLGAFAIAGAASTGLCGIAGLLVGFCDATMSGAVHWPPVSAGEVVLSLFVGFGASFLQLMATAGAVILIAVLSRSMLAAILGSFFILIAAELLAAFMRLTLPRAPDSAALFPNLAGDAIRQLADALRGDPDAIGLHLALPGVAALLMWLLVLSAAAILVFRRQDLPRE